MPTENATLAVAEPQHGSHLRAAEEHGGVWVTCLRCGRQWAIHGSDAEVVSDGDGFCDDQPADPQPAPAQAPETARARSGGTD